MTIIMAVVNCSVYTDCTGIGKDGCGSNMEDVKFIVL